LNIRNDNATYETQFGFVQRPTHKNTTWDIAKVGLILIVYLIILTIGDCSSKFVGTKYIFSILIPLLI
jgi:alpha-mannosidase